MHKVAGNEWLDPQNREPLILPPASYFILLNNCEGGNYSVRRNKNGMSQFYGILLVLSLDCQENEWTHV